MISASILALAGGVLWLTNTNELIALLGLLLLRGTILSLFLVMTFLPGVLLLFDKLIGKTTWHANFFNGSGGEGALAVAGAAAAGGAGAVGASNESDAAPVPLNVLDQASSAKE